MTSAEKALRIITADNPSPFTGPGTNTFLLGRERIAVIDPGPDLAAHRLAILAAAGSGRISHIFVTHAHLDHSGGAHALAQATGAPVLGFGPAEAGRSAVMARLAREGAIDGGEGLDRGFVPDIALADGAVVETEEWRLTALHTPGHFAGHLAFRQDETIFCGDVVMGWSSTIISPPDGDLADYFRSLARLDSAGARLLLPAHGDAVRDPAARLAELAAHRRERTMQILAALRDGPATAEALARRIYRIPPAMIPAATRNVLAHLIALSELGAVSTPGPIGSDSVFAAH
ncbi:MBL fold metallo-hydrolase [Paracoccus sp. P2]|uniref:MBL fold metallo-hydrolase n=1 Tax=Paracoccus pantotrophus TaxID=82367 RepID=A0A7H9BVX8_PARPN|nr:MBL fold metallo-hydrolase [Paracoccus pantotrophus]MDF3856252.1 MBL fold metallo-hydrolase [Paracoccus pantotrophus]QLH14978.1 MBL fold metallo-hydrolase [Paracoccus pantotrophus]RDD96518.1 MBL fold metallo-hydrolase [Paracoccus pantotrophus]RNI15552.1 MBL fold metallo-hydrolase [Paracoccus pantotrophus]WGR65379.1 MBL fold metallo-hydrolase [Paracoccus pantotrophus]